MSVQFLAMPDHDRKLAFDNAALSLHLNAVILEKDFWVSWLLGLLFAQSELAPFLVASAPATDRPMKRSRFSDERINEAGAATANVCRRHGISRVPLSKWKAKLAFHFSFNFK